VLASAGVAVLVGAPPAAADPRSLYQGPGPRPGPDVLYAPPADAPQLQNTGVWQAPPILVSGAAAYRRGEFLYQDWIYDDHGARGARDPEDPRAGDDTFSAPNGTYTYPRDDARYGQNAADLVELRIRPLADATAFRLTYNTLLDPEVVATTIALGDSPAPVPFPHGAGARTRAELFLTVHGATADLRRAAGDAPVAPAPAVSVDRERRQVEIRVPRAAWDPGRGQVRVGAATGLWDTAAGRYLRPQPAASPTTPGGSGALPAPPAFFNVAFRFEMRDSEGTPAPDEEDLPLVERASSAVADTAWWRDRQQAAALRDGDLSRFHAVVDFGRLADGAGDESRVPQAGVINRILPSRFEPRQGVDFNRECTSADACEGQLLGRLQPYAIYVPRRPQPAEGWPLTLLLHSLGANYNQFSGSRNQSQFADRARGSIVMTPAGRGPDGWYYDLAGADTFEVWADIARVYRLDPERTTIAGYSMGGYGSYKLATQFPDLFARGQPTVGPPTLGISTTARDSAGGGPRSSTFFMLPSLRHVPFSMWVGSTDELVPISGTTAQAQGFDDLGYRYEFRVFTPGTHLTLAAHDQYGPAAAFLGDAQVVRDPPRVTYVVNPTMDFPRVGTVADHAYWLSGLRVRDRSGEAPRATVDVRSEGFGAGDPAALPTQRDAGTLPGGNLGTLTFARQAREWGPAPPEPRRDRLTIRATNLARVTIDPRRARVTCRAELEVDSDGPLIVELAGCGRTERFATGARACRAANGFTSVAVQPRGRRLRIAAVRAVDRPFDVAVFRQSRGRTVLGNRRVARFRRRRAAFTWSGRRAGDGVHLVRVSMRLPNGRTDTRRLVVERRRGRFRTRPDSYRRESCGLLSSFKLERPVFGGRGNRALGIAYRTAREATVTVDVLRGRRVVRRFRAGTRSARRTHRLRLASERIGRGDVRIRLTARARGRAPVTATLVARRL